MSNLFIHAAPEKIHKPHFCLAHHEHIFEGGAYGVEQRTKFGTEAKINGFHDEASKDYNATISLFPSSLSFSLFFRHRECYAMRLRDARQICAIPKGFPRGVPIGLKENTANFTWSFYVIYLTTSKDPPLSFYFVFIYFCRSV